VGRELFAGWFASRSLTGGVAFLGTSSSGMPWPCCSVSCPSPEESGGVGAAETGSDVESGRSLLLLRLGLAVLGN
jgi:hypothetical protein